MEREEKEATTPREGEGGRAATPPKEHRHRIRLLQCRIH
jgi:hypothetical protein